MKTFATGLLATFVSLVPAHAATVHVIHGISGGTLGLPATLPVDVWANGAPLIPGFEFGEVVGPVDLPAGTYELRVFLAGSDPDVDTPVLSLDATLADDSDVDIVAHFTENGGIALTPFANNNTPKVDPISPRIERRDTRLTVRHAAALPRVVINRLLPIDPTFANGGEISYDLDPGMYRFWLSRAGGAFALSFDPIEVALDADLHYFVYAVGSRADDSFQLLVRTSPFN
jgi:hypothetical protein